MPDLSNISNQSKANKPDKPKRKKSNKPIHAYTTNSSDKSKITALILCIFLGYLGIHRFYVGKIGTGILYFFTFGVCGLGWLIDIFSIVMGSFRDNVGQPLRK